MMQHFPQHLVLKRRKSGKPIQYDHTVLQHSRFVHHIAENVQNFFFCNIFICKIFFKCLIHHLDILQFPGKIRRLICLRDHIIHAIRGNVVLRQLGNNGFHLTDVTWLFDISF